MINRIDIFMPPISQYGVLHYMTRDIYEAVKTAGIQARLLIPQYDNPKPFLESIFSNRPDCTLSLNGLLPDKDGNFFCDMIKIPHVACLVDSPNQFVSLTGSQRNIITCPDIFACQFFQGLNFKQVLFMPHGVGRDLAPDPNLERIHDVVMFASCIDYEGIRASWSKKFPKPLCEVLDDAAERALSDQTTPYVEAFVQALNLSVSKPGGLEPAKLNILELLDELELYIRGRDRVELIRGIKDAQVDVYGAGKDKGWQKYLGKKSNVRLKGPVPYEEALEIMKQSKIVLNSCPWIKNGGHERLFAAMACGALAITNENVYIAQHFKEGKEVVFYRHGQWDAVNDLVNTYLSDDTLRQKIAEAGCKKTMQEHTWDNRVETLLNQLRQILEAANF